MTLPWVGSTHSSSCVVADQRGQLPPPVDTRHGPPGPGNGRTYTSLTVPPFSIDEYAMNRPSGENIGPLSCAGVPRNTVGVPAVQPVAASPFIGRIMRSQLPLA